MACYIIVWRVSEVFWLTIEIRLWSTSSGNEDQMLFGRSFVGHSLLFKLVKLKNSNLIALITGQGKEKPEQCVQFGKWGCTLLTLKVAGICWVHRLQPKGFPLLVSYLWWGYHLLCCLSFLGRYHLHIAVCMEIGEPRIRLTKAKICMSW